MSDQRTTAGAVPRGGVLIAHLRLVLIDTFRDPAALIGNIVIPVVCLLFFVLPNRSVVDSGPEATKAALQLTSMLGFSTCLFGYSASVAQDRESGFGSYLRTLPVGAAPRFLAVAIGAASVTLVGLALLWILALTATAATVTASLAAGFAGLVLTMITWSLFGAALGQVVSMKTVITVAQLIFLALAFAGGMLIDPAYMPDGLNSISQYLPSRASRDLVCGLGTGEGIQTRTAIMSIAWTTAFGIALLLTTRTARRR